MTPNSSKSDAIPKAESAFELPELQRAAFVKLIREVLQTENLGAGLDVSGVSGSGKTNFAQWTVHTCGELQVPFIYIDPHGDGARKAWRLCLDLPERVRRKIVYWKVADPKSVAAIDPLAHDPNEDHWTEYERLSAGRIQVELTANIVLAAVGESTQGFVARPTMRKWMTRWLWTLWRARLTLADAGMLIDPQNEIYELLMKLVPDDLARHQMESLAGMRASEQEAEIGSARNRIASTLEHPAGEVLLSRRKHTINFREFYANGMSLIVDLDRGGILSEEVQRLICNVVLNQYLAVVLSTPEQERRRRICLIDELPVFNESCGPLLERMATEIRKYKTSFVFLHQGGARFAGRTDNEFLRTIIDMCRVKVLFRHNVDAEFFGKLTALAAHGAPRIKHVQTTTQQLQIGHEIMELMDRGEGSSEMTGQTETDGTTETDTVTSNVTEALSRAVHNADEQTESSSRGDGSSKATGRSKAVAKQHTTTRTANVTRKQTLVPILETKEVVSSLQFFSKEEIEWGAAALLKELRTGEAVVMVDGVGVWRTQTPEALDHYQHAPKFASRKLAEWRAEMLKRPEFASPETIKAERREFLQSLLRELLRLPDPLQGRIATQSNAITLVEANDIREAPEVGL